MGTTFEYAIASLLLSLLALSLSSIHAYRIATTYRRWQDERSAIAVAKAMGLAVIALGMSVSSLGLLVDHASLGIMGLSMARGAFVALVATLVLADTTASRGAS